MHGSLQPFTHSPIQQASTEGPLCALDHGDPTVNKIDQILCPHGDYILVKGRQEQAVFVVWQLLVGIAKKAKQGWCREFWVGYCNLSRGVTEGHHEKVILSKDLK